ncbi:unnamed protein product [Lactuca saligna]|uniref:Mechanosensitive ion channel MscS domain-containing protein n=1 Tax=Lactuca saligna TaxID=75948 RepID=A0AA35Z4B9_LACSI|nr:unnamed protein product [Lactuca saligna]
MTENKSGEVVLTIPGEEKEAKHATFGAPRDAKPRGVPESPHRKSVDSYPENAYFMPSPNRPPKIPNPETLTRRKTLARSIYSKPKSRFGEQPLIDHNMFDEMHEPVGQTSNSPMRISARASPRVAGNTTTASPAATPRTLSITPKTPLMASPGGAGGDESDNEEEIYKKVNIRKQLKLKRVKLKVLFQWVVLLFLVGCIVASLTIHKLEEYKIWSLELWKWFVLITVIICVLVTWTSLFNSKHVGRSKNAAKVLDYLTWTIVALLVGSILWLLKTFLLKILATSFHVSNFFDRIQESIFLQYVLHTLSGPPVMESLQNVGASTSKSQFSLQVKKNGKDSKTKKEVIDVSKLHQMKREKVSAWTMKMLVDTISNSGLSTFSGELEESAYYGEGIGSADKEITSEMEAIAAAYHIFRNVAQPGFTYIEDIDLRRFMIKEEVDIVFPMIDVAEKGQIDRKTLTEWVVKVYNGRKALAHALDDTKTALVVAAFIFGNTCKTVFEAIVFVFIMHPFDVGDRCVIDGVQMVVEEMNILNTVFLKFDNEKIYYPNSVLATKPISNFYRSPDMGDKVEFSIDFATPFEKIGLLKDKIKKYLEKNPQLWYANHNFVVKEIENVNMIKSSSTTSSSAASRNTHSNWAHQIIRHLHERGLRASYMRI